MCAQASVSARAPALEAAGKPSAARARDRDGPADGDGVAASAVSVAALLSELSAARADAARYEAEARRASAGSRAEASEERRRRIAAEAAAEEARAEAAAAASALAGARADDGLSERVGRAGQAFAAACLGMEDVYNYMGKLLEVYASALNYGGELAHMPLPPGAVRIATHADIDALNL